MRTERLSCVVLACAALAGCSALIDPDVSRLGGDGGQSGLDGGRADAGPSRDGGSDGGPVCPASCDDRIACTADACRAGRCVHTPSDGACAAGERCSVMMGCVSARCTSDAACADGVFCNGVERCDTSSGACVSGAPPDCGDGASCTADRCDASADACVHEANDAACADAVSCSVDVCDPAASTDASGCAHRPDDARCASDFCTVARTCAIPGGCTAGVPRDCRDGDPCTSDACDATAGACVNAPRDDDGDGAATDSAVGSSGVVACGGTDCDDTDPDVGPSAVELCNGVDDDCDGSVDEGCSTTPDDCGSASAIVLDASGAGSASGTFASVADDYQTNAVCGALTGGRDAVYYVDLPAGTWDVTIDTIGSSADTVLAVGLDCGATGFQAACNDDYGSSSSTASRVWVHRIGSAFGTRLYVLVDAYRSSTTGAYQVNVQRTAAAGDRCPTSTGTPFDISGGGTLLGFQSGFVGATRGSCQPTWDSSGEAVLFLRGPASGNVRFDVYSTDFAPAIYLRHSPCSSGTEVDCENATALGGGVNGATIDRSVTAGDAYFLFVDGGRTAYAVYYEPF